GQIRAALVCHLKVAADGTLKSWRFTRAKICVSANIAYEDAQAAMDKLLPLAGEVARSAGKGASEQLFPLTGEVARSAGKGASEQPESPPPSALLTPPPVGDELARRALQPLWDCWRALFAARKKRDPLELDLPERRVVLDETGRIVSIAVRDRLDAHRLIEDFMIAANVAAAKALEAKKSPVMYRVHEVPGREKLVALRDYLATFGVNFALGQVVTPATFNRLLALVADAEHRTQVMEQVLRTQTQAYYAPANMGHFGLALGSYAHFTSPIRRYADVLVHRALVRGFGLGEGGLTDDEADGMARIGEAISAAERRAMEAERETVDRYVAAFLSTRVGEVLDTRITGVANFGFFATVEGIGGDGLVPVSTLGDDYYRFDEAARTLEGDATGTRYAAGMTLQLRLAEAHPISGALRFELPDISPRARPAIHLHGKRRHRRPR
nr:RNB domain-containing ribonuclease [Sphingomonadaceae bacterium]